MLRPRSRTVSDGHSAPVYFPREFAIVNHYIFPYVTGSFYSPSVAVVGRCIILKLLTVYTYTRSFSFRLIFLALTRLSLLEC